MWFESFAWLVERLKKFTLGKVPTVVAENQTFIETELVRRVGRRFAYFDTPYGGWPCPVVWVYACGIAEIY